MAALSLPHPSSGCRLVADDGRALPLVDVRLAADGAGGLARVVLRQVFKNPHAEPLQVTYLLPLPADAAVVDFAFELAGRRIVGEVDRRADARRRFEEAVIEGRTAAIIEQDRPNTFKQEIGNLPGGAELAAEIVVEQWLTWRDGSWEWRFPTVVAPRYLGAPGHTPDAERVTVDVIEGATPVRAAVELRIGDDPTGSPWSPSHALSLDGSTVGIRGAALDRDLVIRWPVARPEPGASLEVTRWGDEAVGLFSLVPPDRARASVPRDLTLLLDISGSMSGRPLAQLQAFSTALVSGLEQGDRLEMIAFASRPSAWQKGVIAIDGASREAALQWIRSLSAGGGTEMHEAVLTAVRPLRPLAQRQVVLMTDGHIGFEQQIVGELLRSLPKGSRLHTVGVGSAVNRALTGPAARAGAGVEVVVGLDEDVGEAVAMLLSRTSTPVVVDVTISGEAVRDVTPMRIPDLFAGAPLRALLRLDPRGGTILVQGRTQEGPFERRLVAPPAGEGRRVLVSRYGRERVEDLEARLAAGAAPSEVDAEIESLGLACRISTRLTSWLAISTERTVDPGSPTRRALMPQTLPYGVSAEGVGLRSSAMPVGAPAPSQAYLAGSAGGAGRAVFHKTPAAPPPPPKAAATMRAVAEPASRSEDRRRASADRASEGESAREEKAKKQAPKKEAVALDALFGMAAPILTLVAKVRSRDKGRLVLTFEVTENLSWNPAWAQVTFPDGSQKSLNVLEGTTSAGLLKAGLEARVVVALDDGDPLPSELYVGAVHLLVVG